MYRVVLWTMLCLVWVGHFVCGLIVLKSFEPKPGANMVLMGLQCVALPTIMLAALLALLALARPNPLHYWERAIALTASGSTVAVFGLMLVLG
jgi:hypothetical protein